MYAQTGPGQPRRGGGNPSVNQMRQSAGIPISASQSRIPEMLEQVKSEYESILQQLSIANMERDDFERKIQTQLQEMDQIQSSLKALESNHRRIRQHYEEDIMRMRRQVEGQAVPIQTGQSKVPKRGRPMSEDTQRMQGAPGRPVLVAGHGQTQVLPPRNNSPARMPTTQPQLHQSLQQQQYVPPVASQQPPLRSPTQQSIPVQNSSIQIIRQHENKIPSQELMESSKPISVPNPQTSFVVTSSAPMSSPKTGAMIGISAPVSISTTATMTASMGVPTSSTGAPAPPVDTSRVAMPSNGISQEEVPSVKRLKVGNEPSEASAKETKSSAVSEAETNPTDGSDTASSKSKVKWTIQYNSKSSSYPETERPHVEMKHTLDHQSVVCCVQFSSDGTKMATGCHKSAQVFDVETGEHAFAISRPTDGTDGEDAYVRAVCFSPDGTKIVAGMPQNTIRMWDISTKKEGLSFSGHESEIYSLDYVKNLIASGSGDRKVRLWNDRDGSCHAVLGDEQNGPKDGVTSVALSPDGRLLAAASLDKVIRIWDTSTAKLTDRLEGHNDSVYSIAFSPDGKNVISGSLDRTLMLWDVSASGRTTTRPRLLFQGHKDFVLSVAYTPDGRWLMSGSKDRTVLFWDPRSTRSVLTLSGYRNSVISVASSPSSPHFATGSGDCFACIWKYQCQTI